MGNLRDSSILALTALSFVACSDDPVAKMPDAAPIVLVDAAPDAPPVPIDAPPPTYDFTCEGMALPTTAANSIVLSGTTTTLTGFPPSPTAAPAVTVELFKQPNVVTPADTKTSDANGAFAMAAQANATMMPYDAYLKATKAGHRPTYVYPPSPFIASQSQIPVLILTPETFGQLNQILSGGQTAGNGAIGLLVVDCANTPINGVTVSTTQGGVEVGTKADVSSLSAQAEGLWFVFNVPPGDTVVSATYMGHTWRLHTVTSFADSTTTTLAVP